MGKKLVMKFCIRLKTSNCQRVYLRHCSISLLLLRLLACILSRLLHFGSSSLPETKSFVLSLGTLQLSCALLLDVLLLIDLLVLRIARHLNET